MATNKKESTKKPATPVVKDAENGRTVKLADGTEHVLKNGDVLKKNADGTLSVTVGRTVEEPQPATIELSDGKVAIGVAKPEAKRRYCLARAVKLGDEFVPDETTWKTGAELLDGAVLEAPVKSGISAEFFKVVVE